MISNLIVFSTLFLGLLFTVLYVVRPEFRARIEQPKTTFLQQLSMYDKSTGVEQYEAEQYVAENEEGMKTNSKTKPAVRHK